MKVAKNEEQEKNTNEETEEYSIPRIETILHGSVAEAFNDALEEIALSALDLNVPAAAKRAIVLKLEFKVSGERTYSEIIPDITVTKPKPKAVFPPGGIHHGRHRGKLEILQSNPQQQELPNIKWITK